MNNQGGQAKRSHWPLLLMAVWCAGLLAGCGQSKPPQAASTKSPSLKSQPTTLEQSVSLWAAGNQEAAVDKFLQVDWAKGRLFSTGSILSYSEAEFVALPEAAREKLNVQMLADITSLKRLCHRVKELGQDATAKGDQAKAAKYFTALKQCGERLDRPSSLKIVQLVGRAFKKMAN